MSVGSASTSALQTVRSIRDALPSGGLFADQHWRVSPTPFPLDKVTGSLPQSLKANSYP